MRAISFVAYFCVFALFTFAETNGKHWAWQPLEPPSIPQIKKHTRPVDAFILHRLGPTGLTLAPEASRRTLIRRRIQECGELPLR